MKLYHYTSPAHLRGIMKDRRIDTTESNVSWTHAHHAPDVVWLTTCDTPRLNHGLHGSIVDKTAIRLTVEVPNDWPKCWKKWAKTNGASAYDMEMLAETGGGWEAADTWFVVTRPIPFRYITQIAAKEEQR